MYHPIKKLMYTVNVGSPDPRFGKHVAGAIRPVLTANLRLRCSTRFKGSTVRSRPQRHADGHRNGRVNPSGDRGT